MGKKEKLKKMQAEPPRPVSLLSLVPVTLFVASLAVLTFARNAVYESTVTVWRSAVESSPNKARAHENYGQALSSVGRLEEALRQFKTVLAMKQQKDDGSVPYRDLYRELGVVYFRLSLYEEAIIAWQKGLEHAPFDAGIMNNLSIAYLRTRRLDEARSHAEMAARSNPLMPEPLNTLGEIHFAMKQYDKALRYYYRFIEVRPEDPRGYWNAAIGLEKTGDRARAKEFVRRFLTMERDPKYRGMAMNFLAELEGRKR